MAWIENVQNESLQAYAARMALKIKHENPVLIGLSFGGLVAQEIAAIVPVKELILISTIKSKAEKPWYMSLAGSLNATVLMPTSLLKRANKLVAYAFSLVNPEEEEVLQSCFQNMSPQHLKWAMKQIAQWKGIQTNTPIFHIHSTKDRVFRSNRDTANAQIGGGHFAVFTNADELNVILKQKLTF